MNKSIFDLTLKITVVILPFLLFFSLVTFLLCRTGELADVDRLILRQSGNAFCLYGPAYSDQAIYYKYHSVLNRHPKILALGTSRVMQFRNYFFYNRESFFNAGGAVRTMNEFVPFLENIKSFNPEVLIIGLDQYFFNDAWLVKNSCDRASYEASLSNKLSVVEIVNANKFRLAKDAFYRKVSFHELCRGHVDGLVGINARVKENGFRNDGSYRYGSRMASPTTEPDYQFHDTFERIRTGSRRFEFGKEISIVALAELEKILQYCRQNNIHIVGFLPPFAPSVNMKLRENRNRYEYLGKISSRVAPLFQKYSFNFCDFSDTSAIGSIDSEFVDGFHGSDVTYARILIEMAKLDPILASATDMMKLQQLTSRPANQLELVQENLQ